MEEGVAELRTPHPRRQWRGSAEGKTDLERTEAVDRAGNRPAG